MTDQGWRQCVIRAASDPAMLNLLEQLLYQQDMAKDSLRRKGYGVTGTPWPEVVSEVPARAPCSPCLDGIEPAEDDDDPDMDTEL